MKLTRERAIKEHRKMWNHFANIIKEKKDVQDIFELKREYFFGKFNNMGILHNCYLCEYTDYDDTYTVHCDLCPLEWESNRDSFMCEEINKEYDGRGLYIRCRRSSIWEKQYELAVKIANLKERDT